jgi:hypothetical protein
MKMATLMVNVLTMVMHWKPWQLVCKIHNARLDVGGAESHNSVPAMEHDQILKDIKS